MTEQDFGGILQAWAEGTQAAPTDESPYIPGTEHDIAWHQGRNKQPFQFGASFEEK